MRLTERDFRLLRWIGEQFIINKVELAKLLRLDAHKNDLEALGQHVTRGLLNRWKKYDLIASFHHLRRGSHVYLTARGTEASGLTFKASRPRYNAFTHLSHHDAVNQLRLYLERDAWQTGQELFWLSERHLMQLEREKNGEYKFRKQTHRPDAILQTQAGDIAIEVERTYKRPKRLQGILKEYLYQTQYKSIHYYCSSLQIQQNVQRALTGLLSDSPLIAKEEIQDKINIQLLPFDDPT